MNKIEQIYKRLEKSITFEPVINKLARKKAAPFQILIATMVSARTKDEVTEKAAGRLFSVYKTARDLINGDIKKIEKLIYPVGFYKTKAKNIIEISRKLLAEFKGSVPRTITELTTLPGVGLKTAALVMAEGFGIDEICVDTHVHRISNRLGFVKTKTPEQTYTALKKKLPKKLWRRTNFYMVSYGKTVCKPIGPRCDICTLNELCPKIGVKNKE
ncbi:MAG: endonuclease III [Pseudomonadota bacterium]